MIFISSLPPGKHCHDFHLFHFYPPSLAYSLFPNLYHISCCQCIRRSTASENIYNDMILLVMWYHVFSTTNGICIYVYMSLFPFSIALCHSIPFNPVFEVCEFSVADRVEERSIYSHHHKAMLITIIILKACSRIWLKYTSLQIRCHSWSGYFYFSMHINMEEKV